MSSKKNRVSSCLFHRTRGGLLAVGLLSVAGTSHADRVQADGKGIAGGALLGAEAVILTEALVGLETDWFYWLGGLAGAAGGAVGGYYMEQAWSPRVSFYSLAAGMAFTIPIGIIYLDATAEAEQGPSETPGPNYDQEPDYDLEDGQAQVSRSRPTVSPPSFSLLAVQPEQVMLGLPLPIITPMYSMVEQDTYRVRQGTQWLLPVLQATF